RRADAVLWIAARVRRLLRQRGQRAERDFRPMSIVEKAMIRSQAERAKAPAAAGSAAESRDTSSLPWMPRDVEPLRVASKVAFEQFPPLARDFRFLKRPVLARVFGLSRSSPRTGNLVMITSDMPQAG